MARTTTFYTQTHSVFDHSIWREKQRLKLSKEEFLVFLYLNHNEKIEITGLYEVNFWEMTLALSLNEEEANSIINSLQERKMLVWDSSLVYVPTIKKRHNFIGLGGSDRYWKTKVKKSLSYQNFDTINTDHTPNNAFLAWQNNNTKLISDYLDEKEKERVRYGQSGTDSRDSQQSGTDSRDSQQSGTDSRDSQQSGTDSRDSQQSGTDSCDSQQSGTDSCDSQQSGTDSCDSQQSGTDSRDSQQSGTDSCDSQQSGTDSRDSQQSGTDSRDSQQSGTDSCDSQQSGTDSRDSQQSKPPNNHSPPTKQVRRDSR